MARAVCFVLFLNPRVGNVCRGSVPYSRDVLFEAGGRGLLSQTGPAYCDALVDR